MSLPKPYYQSDKATLYCGDCLDILPHLSGVDCVVTDPPYGIKYNPSGGGHGWMKGGKTFTDKDLVIGDNKPFDPAPILSLGIPSILFGANHYKERLPTGGRWFVWDKREGRAVNDFSDCELAWCSEKGPDRVFSHIWNGCMRESERGVRRVHPTQKAVAVMAWCIGHLIDSFCVFDPYAGSGTTGVAAINLGRRFVGVEIDPKYCEVAAGRIRDAEDRLSVLGPPRRNNQLELLEVKP